MVVVRSLTTLLNFKLDTTNLKKFNNEIFGIKTRVNSIFGEISDRLRAGFDFLSDISKAALQTQDLAKYSGIAVKDFTALRNVAGQFGINAEKFNETFSRFSLGVKEASRRSGFLLEIIRELPHQINIKGVNDTLRPTQEILFEILKSISSIADESEQLRLATNLFGDIHLGQRMLDLIKQSPKEFKKLLDEQLKFGEALQKDLQNFTRFNTETNKLYVAFGNLRNLIAGAFSPLGLGLLKPVTGGIESLNNLILKLRETGAYKGFQEFSEKPVKSFEEFSTFLHGKPLSLENNSTNNITVNVASGTPEQQVNNITNEITVALNNFHREKVRELINNNPVYEA